MGWRRRFGLRPVPSAEVRGIMMAAVDGRCTNCETPLAEPRPNFCPECGQDTNLNPPTLREFWAQFTDTYLAPKGAMWATLKMLLARPGELTAQYLTGRRRQYVLPLRLFGLATVVMLVVMRVVSVIELSVLDDPALAAALAQRPTQVSLELGFGRAGSTLFWKSHATGEPADPDHAPEPLAFAAIGGLLAGLVLLTVFAGPVKDWLDATAAALHAPAAYIGANNLPGVN